MPSTSVVLSGVAVGFIVGVTEADGKSVPFGVTDVGGEDDPSGVAELSISHAVNDAVSNTDSIKHKNFFIICPLINERFNNIFLLSNIFIIHHNLLRADNLLR